MLRKYLSCFLIVFLVVFSPSLTSAESDLLNTDDIPRVMGEIFEQHVDKNEITSEVLKNSFHVFVDQFDPERTYLLEREVRPFLQINSAEISRILKQYKRKDFSKYEALNKVIQNAVSRARRIRNEFLRQSDTLFQKSTVDSSTIKIFQEEQKGPFAETTQELRSRIEKQIIQFISLQRQRYGDKAVLNNKRKTVRAFEKQKQHKENQYLYEDTNGRPLPLREKGNLFTMHVLKALTRSLDSHTTYLDANEAYDMKIRLEKGFYGIGIILQKMPQGIVISRLIKDGPAERSQKVKVNDRIVRINGKNVEEDTLEDLVDKLRDKTTKTVYLVIKRAVKQGNEEVEKTVSVTLIRELIAVDEGRVDSEYEPFENGIIGKITLYSFYQGSKGVTSEKDLRKAIKDLEKKGPLRGLILDLRENSGGFLNQAVKVAGLFITNGVVVVSKYSNGEQRYYRDMDGKVSFDGPMIVLTSKATASAAEIVAQALQDYGVAVIVGDKHTYGKGTIQSQTVTNGKSTSNFKVTVGKYYTPSGKTPQMSGVMADIVVPGLYSKELIGEEYLEYPLTSDTIAPSFKDKLADVDRGLRPWYVRYYMPTLQERETEWKEMLPELKKNSEKRIATNEDFQQFLKGNIDRTQFQHSKKPPKTPDFQMEEATRILKDMIILEKKMYRSRVVGS
ncbi:MAG: S41 family peptidase [Waddliaceae bacterium]